MGLKPPENFFRSYLKHPVSASTQGEDPREVTEDEANPSADVKQYRTFDEASGTWSSDQCPPDGGLDQDIYGDYTLSPVRLVSWQ